MRPVMLAPADPTCCLACSTACSLSTTVDDGRCPIIPKSREPFFKRRLSAAGRLITGTANVSQAATYRTIGDGPCVPPSGN